MRVPLSWLQEFVDLTLPPAELAQRITFAGLEVNDIEYIGVDGAALPWDTEKILVANILEVRPHPNADRLVLADVDYGGDQPHTVVTGAPNLFPFKGQGRLTHPLKSIFAREGARLYDGHQDGRVIITLKGRPVRGVMSDAMLCSEKELGLSDDHEGIIFLEDDAPVGMPARDFLGEVVLDIDLTPNLARCLSLVGVAREVAALTGAALHIPDPYVQMDGPPIEGRAQVTIMEPQLCPRFTLALVENITVGPSPHWMQRRLRHAGMRPVNNIVDISNYVMLEWGEPSHAFDADKVHGHHLIARLAQSGERLTTLDGKERLLEPPTADVLPPLVVADPQGPLGVAGVMGGEDSEVREATTRVLLEAAIWEPAQIRRTAQAFKLPSEASRRFERGVDYNLPLPAQRRALELMRTLAGGTVAQGIIDVYPRPWKPVVLELPRSEIARIVGIQLDPYEITALLTSVGFRCQVDQTPVGVGDFVLLGSEALVRVEVPSYRQDVTLLADLCEEVARLYGYDRIPATRLADEIPPPESYPDLEIEQKVRNLLVGSGLNEVITYSLTNMEAVALVTPSAADAAHYLRLSNPTTPERAYLRRSLLPTLLEALASNLRESERVLLFEMGRVFFPRDYSAANDVWLPDEPRRLSMALAGPRTGLSWHAAGGEPLDFFDLKGIIELLLERLGIEQVACVPLTDDERFHPGRAAALLARRPSNQTDAVSPEARGNNQSGKIEFLSERIGVFGELHPALCERLEISVPRASAAELDLDMLIALTQPPHYTAISRFPATVQDLAVVAADHIPVEQVSEVIRRSAGTELEACTLFDVYSGPQLGEGRRSLAYRLSFRAADRTLSDEALTKVRTRIVKALERDLGATIRT